MSKRSLLSAFLTAFLIGGLFLASPMNFLTVQALSFTVDSISKPSVPEFSVRTVAYPYDVPPKNTTTIDQYTGKETTYTQPGYHVENKSIEITIKNQPFTPYTLTTHTSYNHETGESYAYNRTSTVNLYYDIGVKGHYVNDSYWTTVGTNFSFPEGYHSNAQLDSEYTVISTKADDYPKDAVLDFRVRTLTGFYVPYYRGLIIVSFDFYGQESNWSNTLTLALSESQTPTPSPTATPYQEPPIIGVAIAAAVIVAVAGFLIYLIKKR